MPSKLRGFSHPDVCWESCTMSCRQSRRLLENMEDNFLTQKGSDTAPLVGICHPAKLNSPQGSSGFDEVLFGYTQEFTQLKQNQQILQVIETYSTHTDNLTTDFLGPNHIPGEGRQSKPGFILSLNLKIRSTFILQTAAEGNPVGAGENIIFGLFFFLTAATQDNHTRKSRIPAPHSPPVPAADLVPAATVNGLATAGRDLVWWHRANSSAAFDLFWTPIILHISF
ncbi:uncharacterized protein LOC135296223 isoform X2 [Passer domesticus]|uniref:uncharacterized protein LOC135296223 isoform X2 n=1 Tax=Passer domesticus TaxID=48849 RepID=UPI0030FDF7A4